MTDRQREVLTFIRGYLHQHGYPPTLIEIARGVGLTHRSTAHRHCQILVRRGHLEPRDHRGVTAYFPVETEPAAA